jgi:fumarate hydratase subunit beta
MPKRLTLPMTESDARALEAGDEVLVRGRIITACAAAHRELLAHDHAGVRAAAEGSLVYHCSPAVHRDASGRGWRFLAAGPTPSMRQEPYQADVLVKYGLRGAMGQGGMGPRTLAAFAQHGAIYLHAVRGLAVVLARRVARVIAVHGLEELGTADAIWEVEVEDFPAVVTMDAHGRNLHAATIPEACFAAGELLDGRPA